MAGLFVFSALSAVAQDGDVPEGVDGYIQLIAVDREDWRVVDYGGEGVYTSRGQASIHLLEGNEYYLDLSEVDSEHYPLDVVGTDGTVLLSQREDAVTSDTEGVNAEADEDGISFVLTEELAERITMFRATPYPAMFGFITAVSEEEDEQEGEQEEEEGEGEQEE
ncbi:MAG: hypothetical protein ACLFNX_06335 [Spirochaetaceae bacterium]